MTYDVIVIGAGPGGAATGILLAEAGVRVLILDRARFPRPKICGEYLSPEGARVLDRLGALKAVDAAGAVPIRGMTVVAPDGTRLDGTYPTAGRWRGYRDHGLAIPRLVLDAILTDRLRATAADFREQYRVTDLRIERGSVVGVEAFDAGGQRHEFRAPLVVGADGRNSVVARRLGLVSRHRLRRFALLAYVTRTEETMDRGEIFVDPPDYAILNPLAPGRGNLSLVVPLRHAAAYRGRLETFFEARLKQLPHLAPRLATLRRQSPVLALGPLAYRVRRPRAGGVMLVGDAAGFYDPFTGEGMYAALRGAELAAEAAIAALRNGDVSARALGVYGRAQRREFRGKAWVTRALQVVIGRRWLANSVAGYFARRPEHLALMMGIIGDFVPPRALLARFAGAGIRADRP
jgi:geranylgeranyl reductase family protein